MTDTTKPPRRPGDLHGNALLSEIIRVNQAGEYGARRIYQGQLAVLEKRNDPAAKRAVAQIRHMAEQEEEHLAAFDKLTAERGVRPTALAPLWHVAGYALGAGTALLGIKAAMACTVAVESVIGEHYADQLEVLDKTEEPELCETIRRFRDDELEHHDTGLEEGAEEAPLYPLLRHGIQNASRLAIAIAKKV